MFMLKYVAVSSRVTEEAAIVAVSYTHLYPDRCSDYRCLVSPVLQLVCSDLDLSADLDLLDLLACLLYTSFDSAINEFESARSLLEELNFPEELVLNRSADALSLIHIF